MLSIMITMLVMILAACNGDDAASDSKEKEETTSQEQSEMPEPDLEGVPEVVANVNGEEISKQEFTETYQSAFQRAAMQAQFTGQELDQAQLKKQTVEAMVDQKLLIQEAQSRNLEVTEEEKNSMLEELATQNQLESKDALISALKEQGMTEEQIQKDLETSIKVDKLLTSEVGEFKASEEELQKAYDEYKAQMEAAETEQEVPSFEEMKPDLENAVVSRKENEAVLQYVEKLRNEAEVKVNI